MYGSKNNLGLVESIQAEALGVPGKRIFRILADAEPPAAATLWLEKEQLYGLAMAIKRMVDAGEGAVGREVQGVMELDNNPSALERNTNETFEFKAGRIGLAIGPGPDYISLFFHDERDDSEEEEEEEESFAQGAGAEPKLQLSLTQETARKFMRESLEACASGRGTDALSRGALVATGKVDPNKNGHFHH
ncbi:MAG: DUF3090 family protein [bacterium]|nr:DUF3090 family protein [bacterium]